MTDVSVQPSGVLARKIDYFSAEAAARVKRRYRAETRFKFYGLLAVGIAGLFVVLLLGDIVRKGLPAFHEHQATLDIVLDPAAIDAGGKRAADDLRAGDYQAVVRDALRAKFPDVTDRRARRLLEGLVSIGAPDDLRAAVLANPALVGQTVRLPLLLSDDADLFIKGVGTKVTREAGRGALRVQTSGKDVILVSPDRAFSGVMATLKQRALAAADAASAEFSGLASVSGSSAALDAKRIELTARIAELKARGSDASAPETLDASQPSILIEANGALVKLTELSQGEAKGVELIRSAIAGAPLAETWTIVTYLTPESNRRVSDQEAAWLDALKASGAISQNFAWRFFSNGDSREPELAGIRGALLGTALTLMVTLALCLPIGVGAAVYLEEFAPKNRFTDILEVNINNLAAVPSIVFGLLGLAMFLNFMGLPRSAPLVGGLVLALLVLPTIIIASRAALKAVPPSIKEAALGVGASHQQAIFHHVLPLAMPGVMTGTIIGMAHALGETAPLLMIGMVAFIVEAPKAIIDAATVLPVQVFLWADLPELAFQSKTAAAIMVLLGFLFLMNGAAILLRRRFERRW